ncbi:MAG: anti-sigma factor domain-containing protein [Acidimicrobiales bacterium]
MIHEEIEELLGAYALHATEPEEDREIEAHLAGCPRCRAEVQAHLEVAAMLGSSTSEVPAGLWEKIAASVGEIQTPGTAGKLSVVPPMGTAPFSAARASRRWQAAVWGTVVAVAAAVIAVLGVEVSHLDQQVRSLRTAVGQYGLTGAAAQVALGPHRTIVLTADKAEVAKVVVAPSGTAFWVSSSLRELPSSETYQLWGLARGNIVSLGLVGPDPHSVAPFRIEATITTVMVTAEPSGGTAEPTLPVVAQGNVPPATLD